MIKAAIELHQNGVIPAATYVVDLDAIAENATVMAEGMKANDLRSYIMTKQNGRNPYITQVALEMGFDSTVCVEATEARTVHRYGLPIGHVGHLSNIPLRELPSIVAMEPEVITTFTYENAKAINDAAAAQGRVQDIYVRVNKPGDEFFKGMVGGWTEDECVEGIRPIVENLPNVRVAGLTSFVNITYQTPAATKAKPTDTFFTMLRAKAKLEEAFGFENLRVNAPAFNNSATFKMLAEAGATDVEPGIGLLGSSLAHAYEDLAEKPAQVYVSEVMHKWDGEVYTLGGGLTYIEGSGAQHEYPVTCITGTTFEEAKDNELNLLETGIIDYHGVCSDSDQTRVGDTAIYALRAQFFVNRAYVAIVTGISQGDPKVEALCDPYGTALDENYNPLPVEQVIEHTKQVAARYTGVAS